VVCYERLKAGFTLVETIVASLILCGSILVLAAIGTNCLTAVRLNRQYEIAASLADRQLMLIDYLGVEQFAASERTEGQFDQFEPGYRWEVTTEPQEIDNLYLVTVTVSWVEKARTYKVSVETMFDGTDTLPEVPESEKKTSVELE